MISDYTTPDEIRAVLGVDDTDIADATLALPIYEKYLIMELEDINIDLPATYTTTKALPTPTTAQARFLSTAQVFGTFALAKQLTGSLPLFALQQETDGKAQGQRFANPYKDTIASINKEYDRAKNKLMQALAAIGSTATATTARVYFSTVGLAVDPITNA